MDSIIFFIEALYVFFDKDIYLFQIFFCKLVYSYQYGVFSIECELERRVSKLFLYAGHIAQQQAGTVGIGTEDNLPDLPCI